MTRLLMALNRWYLLLRKPYKETGQNKYADYAGHLAAWFLGANHAGAIVYDSSTGICFDALSATGPNLNSGAESTIEALLSLGKSANRSSYFSCIK